MDNKVPTTSPLPW